MAQRNPASSLPSFGWTQLLLFLAVAVVVGSICTYCSYNAPLTSFAWNSWIIKHCSSQGQQNGALLGSIKDVIRLVLAMGVCVVGFRVFRVFTSGDDSERERLNWLPALRTTAQLRLQGKGTPFQQRFGFEKWVLAGALLLAAAEITYLRPIDFWQTYDTSFPLHAGFLKYVTGLYGAQFAEITKPYLFPYAVYILALWYCVALTTFIALVRSIVGDRIEYLKRVDSLEIGPPLADDKLQNVVPAYERTSLGSFDFVDAVAKCYAIFLVAVLFIAYVQYDLLSCSVLPTASNQGKELLLLLSFSSFVAVVYLYLRLYYQVRMKSLVTIERISDALQKQPALQTQLRDANQLAETVRSKDGFQRLYTLFFGGGAVAVLLGLIWKYVLHQSFCGAANAIFPSWLVNSVATLFQQKCP
jgi:hypothetical protein